MDSLIQEVLIQVVVDMLVTKAAGGAASAGSLPVVVVVGDVQVAKVDVPELVVISDQRALPVVMEIVPRDSDPVRGADDVQLSIVVVRTNLNGKLGAEFYYLSVSAIKPRLSLLTIVIDPDTSAVLNGNSIVANNFFDMKVAEDDVGRIDNCNSSTSDLRALSSTDDGL